MKVFGSVHCQTYAVEWQKKGWPQAHILIWLYDKIPLDEIDDVGRKPLGGILFSSVVRYRQNAHKRKILQFRQIDKIHL